LARRLPHKAKHLLTRVADLTHHHRRRNNDDAFKQLLFAGPDLDDLEIERSKEPTRRVEL
jgi:hypothetical protein